MELQRVYVGLFALFSIFLCGLGCEKLSTPVLQTPAPSLELREQAVCEPPVIEPVGDISRECSGEVTSVFIDPTITSNCDTSCQAGNCETFQLVITQQQIEDPHNYPLGNTSVRITAQDNIEGQSSNVLVSVNVVDTLPPIVDAGQDLTVECTSPAGVAFELPQGHATVRDTCSNNVTTNVNLPGDGILALGNHEVEVIGIDPHGNANSDIVNVFVRDTNPPQINAGGSLFVIATGEDAL